MALGHGVDAVPEVSCELLLLTLVVVAPRNDLVLELVELLAQKREGSVVHALVKVQRYIRVCQTGSSPGRCKRD